MANGQPAPLLRHIRRLAGLPADGERTDAQLLESFVSQHDQAAFEALLWRHGPMVLGTCRRITHSLHDAEDAFQATFLVLCRKGGSISRRESVSSWLYKVAYRIALRVKADASRQPIPESPNLEPPAPEAYPDLLWRDHRPVLDEELNHLPEKYRRPLVLHHLEGKTVAEVARELGWPQGTVLGRLARGRDRLRTRLTRRGITLSAAALAALLCQQVGASPLPPLLATSTLKQATLFVLGQAALAGSVAPRVAALAKGLLQAMLLTKLKITAVVLLTTTLLAASGGVLVQHALAEKQTTAEQPVSPVKSQSSAGDRLARSDRTEPKAVLERVLPTILGLQSYEERVWALCQVARAQERAGLPGAAATTWRKAAEVALESESDHRLMEIMECAAQLGDVAAAFKISKALEEPFSQSNALAHIVRAQVERGDLKEAIANAAKIPGDDLRKREALAAIVTAQAEAGDLRAARETAATISGSADKVFALTAIATQELRAGDRAAAVRTLQQALDVAHAIPLEINKRPSDHRAVALAQIAGAQAEAGATEEARTTAQEIPQAHWQDLAWQKVAAAQAGRGNNQEALRTADRIRDDSHKRDALQAIVASLVRAKDLTTARQVANSIQFPLGRVSALIEVGKGQAQAGQRQAAAQTFREALREAQQITEKEKQFFGFKSAAFRRLAQAQAKVGEENAALAWIDQQPSDVIKACALLGLAEGILERQAGADSQKTRRSEDKPVVRQVDLFAVQHPAEEADVKQLLERMDRQGIKKTQETKHRKNESFLGKLILFGGRRIADGDAAVSLIQALHPDGTDLETILELKKDQHIAAGRVAPNGRRLAFSVYQSDPSLGPGYRDLRPEVWVLETNGRLQKVSEDGWVAAWSPDGTRLACYRGKLGEWESFLVDVEKGQEQQLPIPKTDVVEDWSPDGRTLAVMAGKPDKIFRHPTKGIYPLRQLYLMSLDGSRREELTTDPMLDNIGARFSPDGKRIAYDERKHQDGRVLYEAMVCGRDGKGAKEVVQFNEFYKGNHEFRPSCRACWSPDGKQIVWLIPRRKTQYSAIKYELLFLPPETGVPKRLNLREMGIGYVATIDWR